MSTLSPSDLLIIQRFNAASFFAVQNGLASEWKDFADWFSSAELTAAMPSSASIFLSPTAPPGLSFSLSERSVVQAAFGRTNTSVDNVTTG